MRGLYANFKQNYLKHIKATFTINRTSNSYPQVFPHQKLFKHIPPGYFNFDVFNLRTLPGFAFFKILEGAHNR